MNTNTDRILADYIACKSLPNDLSRHRYMFATRAASFGSDATYLAEGLYHAIYTILLGVAANFITGAVKRRPKAENIHPHIVTILERTEYDNNLVIYRKAIDEFEKHVKAYPDEECVSPIPEINTHRSFHAFLSNKEAAAPHFTRIIVEYNDKTRWGRSRYLKKFKVL